MSQFAQLPRVALFTATQTLAGQHSGPQIHLISDCCPKRLRICLGNLDTRRLSPIASANNQHDTPSGSSGGPPSRFPQSTNGSIPPSTSRPYREVGWTSVDEDVAHTSGEDDNKGHGGPVRALDRDEFKEISRVHFRTVFDHDRWAAHRSTRRYVRHVLGIFQSRMLRGLAPPLMFMAGLSTTVALGHELVYAGILNIPEQLEDVLFLNSALPMTLTSTFLSLLLVFRTNASYSRWLDARKTWGTLVNRSRDIVRQGLTWFPEDSHGQLLRDMLCRWVIVLAYSLKCHVRENEDAVEELSSMGILPVEELEALKAGKHRPVYALQVISLIVRQMADSGSCPTTTGFIIPNMEVNLTQLEDVVGTCERILKTPIPLSYTRHTSRFMMVWLSLLPFALWETCRWGMVPVSVAITLLTLGTEEIGVTIEEPFGILPLEQICKTIRVDIEELAVSGAMGGDNGSRGKGGVVPAAELVRRATVPKAVS